MDVQIITTRTKEADGMGVVPIEANVDKRITITKSAALSLIPCVAARKLTTSGK